jgi:hypothetical protein
MIVDLQNINYDLLDKLEIPELKKKPKDLNKKDLNKKDLNKKDLNKKDLNKSKTRVILKKSNKIKIDYNKIMNKFDKKLTENVFSKKNTPIYRNKKEDYNIFDWKRYIKNYNDLMELKTKDEAWFHWIHHGMNEDRLFFEERNKNIYDLSNFEEKIFENNDFNYNNFDWKSYLNKYTDLNQLKTKDEAWAHFMNYGIKEKRLYNINTSNDVNNNKTDILSEISSIGNMSDNDDEQQLSDNIEKQTKEPEINVEEKLKKSVNTENLLEFHENFIFKTEYSNYGNHYYGWKNVINQLINTLKNGKNKFHFKNRLFIDEWIEKMLLWGNKEIQSEYINYIVNEKRNFITFIHNPAYVKWYNYPNVSELLKTIIYDDTLTNDNVIDLLNSNDLLQKIQFIYTLSINHKEYLYNYYPQLRKKIVSAYHPIELKKEDKLFDIELFLKNKNFFHIGWWLRNFKTYIKDFRPPLGFKKNILVKKDFEPSWNILSKNYDLSNLNVVYEVCESDYEKIFQECCMFVDLEDCTANNLILECIKFCTPIIVRKIPAIVEYLGDKYPLYYNNNEDMLLLNDYNYLINNIEKAVIYLKNMDKTHIELNTFKQKVIYDIEKLNITKEKQKLTWFCLIKNTDTISDIKIFIEKYISQIEFDSIKLKLVMTDVFYNSNDSIMIKEIINEYIIKYENICYVIIDDIIEKDYSEYLNLCVSNTNTKYLTVVNHTDSFDNNYSQILINFLNNNPNADIVFSSYSIKMTNPDLEEFITFDANILIKHNKVSNFVVSNTGMVWRKKIHFLVGNFKKFNDVNLIFREYWRRCINNNMNVICATEKSIYSKNQ